MEDNGVSATEVSENFVLIVFLILTLVLWGPWYWQSFRIRPLGVPGWSRRLLQATPLVCGAILYFVLRHLAATDVRNAASYLCLYILMGSGWLAILENLAIYFGLSARDDVFERNNPAAAVAISGWLLGGNLAFAGSNVGEGPGWYVVVFCAILAGAALLVVWLMLNLATHVAEAISVDRDVASGLRAAGFCVACGLILGWAVAGDWTALDATVSDFLKHGWPVLLLLAVAVVFERALQPTPAQPAPSRALSGVLPALIYVGLAVALLFALNK